MPGTVGRVPTPATPGPGAPTGPGAAVLAHDWADTPLGPADDWDVSLRAVVELILDSPMPMALAYGDDLVLLYNAGYAELLGTKHPTALGRPAAEVFAEIWALPGVGAVIERCYRQGESFLEKESTLPLVRGHSATVEQAVFTRGYSPVRDSAGQIVGVLTVAAETTHVTEQLQSLSEVAAALAGTLTLDDVARVALRYAITTFDPDQASFAVDEGGGGWRMVRRVRGELLDEADERLPPLWRRAAADWSAPVVQAARSGAPSFTRDGQPLRDTAVDRHDQKIRAMAALPLGTSVVRGGLSVGYQVPHTWSPAERALLAASGELIGQAAERAAGSRPSTAQPNCCNAACCRSTYRICPDCGSRPATTRAWTATRPAVTSTTRSCCPTARSAWCWATWPGTTCRPPRGWGRSEPRCAPWPWPTRRPTRSWPAWTGW